MNDSVKSGMLLNLQNIVKKMAIPLFYNKKGPHYRKHPKIYISTVVLTTPQD